MAITLQGPVNGTYDPSIQDGSGGFNLLKQTELAYPPAMNAMALRPLTFSVEWLSTTNTDDPLLLANAVLNLTTLGVLFPVGTMRNILLRCWSKRTIATDGGYCEANFTVLGGAPPTLPAAGAGDAVLATNLKYITATPNSSTGLDFGVPVLNITAGAVHIGARSSTAAALGSGGVAANTRWKLEALVLPLIAIPVSP